MVDVYEYIGRSIRKSNEVDADIGKISDELILPGGFEERIDVHLNAYKNTKIKPDFENSFCLSSHLGGILGENKLGLGSDSITELYSVYNGENTYYETLTSTDFFDTGSTTGTITADDGITLDNGEIVVSKQIFKSPFDVCTAVKLDMVTSDYELGSSTISFKTIDTGSWEEYIEGFGEYHYFASLGSELYYKISSGSDNQYINLGPDLTLFKVEYSTQNQNHIYEDTIESTVFYDTGSSTYSDWDIYNNKIILSSGSDLGTVYTNEITSGNTYNYATLDIGTSTGSYNISISADNKNTWQQLNDGVRTALSSSNTNGVYLRLIGLDVDAAIYNNKKQSTTSKLPTFGYGGLEFPLVFTTANFGYGVIDPAIKLLLEK